MLLGRFPLDMISFQETAVRIESAVLQREQLTIATANIDFLAIARRDPSFRRDLGQFSIIVPDGVPLLWLARAAGLVTRGRVNGTDLVEECAVISARTGARIALVGGEHAVAEEAARVLSSRHGPIAVTVVPTPLITSASVARRVAEQAAQTSPDIVLVGLGAPAQERWILDFLLVTRAQVGIGVGGSFDIIANRLRRAPGWMQRAGLEWLWRLGLEPSRLAGRYLKRDLPAALAVLAEVIRDRAGPRRSRGRVGGLR